MRAFPLVGRTIPHTVMGKFGACQVRMVPASPGTGVIAGAAVRAPLEMLGVQDCLTKAYGSTNPKNLVKAVMNGLEQLRTRETVGSLRGLDLGTTSVEDAIERSKAFMTTSTGEKAVAPVNTVGQESKGGRGRGGRGRGGEGRGDGRGRGRRSHADQPADAGTDASTEQT
jgi:small subunit ribosomal protein S5